MELEAVKNFVDKCLSPTTDIKPYLYRLARSSNGSVCSKYGLTINGEEYRSYLADLRETYFGDNDRLSGLLNEFEVVKEYDGSDLEYTLWYKKTNDETICDVWKAIDNAAVYCEKNWLKKYKELKKAKGFMVEGHVDGKNITLLLASAPIWQLKHGLMMVDGMFKVIRGNMITLPSRIDVVRVDDTVFFLTKQGLSMTLSLEHLDEIGQKTLDEMEQLGKIKDFDVFRGFASSFNNKRRMMRCDTAKFLRLSDKEKGNELRQQFGIRFKNGKLIASTQEEADRLVKVICDRGMTDPFTLEPMEVAGAGKWKK